MTHPLYKKTLRELREERNWAREYVALQVGVTYSTVANLETGRHLPRIDLAQKLARRFKTSVDDIEWLKRDDENAESTD